MNEELNVVLEKRLPSGFVRRHIRIRTVLVHHFALIGESIQSLICQDLSAVNPSWKADGFDNVSSFRAVCIRIRGVVIPRGLYLKQRRKWSGGRTI